MKLSKSGLIKIFLSFVAGSAFGYFMNYIFFSVTPNVGQKYGIFIDILNWTLGLPMILSAMIASSETVKLLMCGEVAKSTFGCWGGLTLRFSIILYGLIFALVYFLLNSRKSNKQ